MALTRAKKEQLVTEIGQLLNDSKMTIMATYQGTTVKAMQNLRRQGRDNGTVFKIVKNRLVKKALESNETFKTADTTALKGMLLYAFNSRDEAAPAQVIANFAKTHPTLEFAGAFSPEGKFINAEDVKALSSLPGRNELIGQVLDTLAGPVNGVLDGLSGSLHTWLDAVESKAVA